MWYVCDVLYAVLNGRVRCFVVRGCAVLSRYINVCNYIQSVYSPFVDGVGPPPHNIPSPGVLMKCIGA